MVELYRIILASCLDPYFPPKILITVRQSINETLCSQKTKQRIFFCLGKQYMVSININNNIGSTYFFKNQSFSGVGEVCLYFFANCTSHLFLIYYNVLHLKVEILLRQLA